MHRTEEDETTSGACRRGGRGVARQGQRRRRPTAQEIEKRKQRWLEGQVQGWAVTRSI